MNALEWDGIVHNEKTKRGEEIMRVSKNGNIRVIYNKDRVMGKYLVERKMRNAYGTEWWDRFGMFSSDFLGEVERECKYMSDEIVEV